MNRVSLLLVLAAVSLAPARPAVCAAPAAAALTPVEYRLQLDTVRSGFDKKFCWVHARAGIIPGTPPSVMLTMQKLLLTGSDVYYGVAYLHSDDLGKTWSQPVLPGKELGRRDEPGGIVACACDVWPKWHAKSGKLLAIGHTVRYRNNAVYRGGKRAPCYTVYDPATRAWTPWATLEMPDDERFRRAGAGSVQRVDLANGQILLPIGFAGEKERYAKVTVLRCGFDGRKLTPLGQGNELAVDTDRGLGEPSLARFQGRYYLTIRHDKAGYVSTSDDGQHFSPPRKWLWDDGTDLGNYNTQQHWVTHDDGLFLVYTRRGANNDHVFRHRAPLFMGRVDPERLCVIRASERIVVPQRGARLGNFGVTEVSPNETWVMAAEWMQTKGPNPYDFTIPMKYGADNSVFAARILWTKPNQGWNTH